MKSIPIDRPLSLPEKVRGVINTLHQKGHETYLVGGSVRDSILGREPKDLDLATGATPDQVLELFPQGLTVGKQFGVIQLLIEGLAEPLEIATFRKDGDYLDARRPNSVEFSEPKEDALRRDFTVNGLFFDTRSQRIIDFVGGFDDLKAKLIRAIGDPKKRFQEDALRLLRAVRLACALEFEIESETEKAMSECAKWAAKVSPERVSAEFHGIFKSRHSARAFRVLKSTGILHFVFPELDRFVSGEFEVRADRILKGWDSLASANPTLLNDERMGWAVLCSTRDIDDSKLRDFLVNRKLSTQWVEEICWIIREQKKFRELFEMRESTIIRWVRHPDFSSALALYKILALATDGNLAFYEFALSRFNEENLKSQQDRRPFLVGKDLIELGMVPGPKFAEILTVVEDMQLENRLQNREEALDFVIRHYG